jgi:hypothetical protein
MTATTITSELGHAKIKQTTQLNHLHALGDVALRFAQQAADQTCDKGQQQAKLIAVMLLRARPKIQQQHTRRLASAHDGNHGTRATSVLRTRTIFGCADRKQHRETGKNEAGNAKKKPEG